ncbi:UDP-N-acetylmuramyl pentapeptide phosphotransferase/UDP-N-acetylglucosamine-1-phosphate transferase [Micromonospora violae]|uniref:UDP-N-acetylmuramyl pentapeptide phosphotransferase/UDP-N-acetylglucosamine-1-phosphate transferase n=1 Tax=Micromonospora violae TaxID=1278207 RepID=A0A4Q7UBE8_9ACTN|nr:UDP-phosphate glycosyltransferase [Micromonospora violae]RZT77498.1 UDP-N-acetylmuramyl pentapeptide phosphotransferase/UDP-N-acetylglucosamine-1-phosphate transferase [Micromonospora violae]
MLNVPLAGGIVLALVVGTLLQPLILRLLKSAAVLDIPSERSSHSTPIPRGGGVGVAAAAGLALLLNEHARSIAVPLLFFAAIGLLEDLWGAPIRLRLLLQLLAGVATGLVLVPGGQAWYVHVLLVLALAAWLTSYVNAFNFMDGINGISTVHAILGGAVYAALGVFTDLPLLTAAGSLIAAASLTFLPWNAWVAKVFLGDVGSYALGGALSTIAAYAIVRGVPPEAAVAPLALYLADTGWTLLRRISKGEAWYRPHRNHAYQRLTDAGRSHQRVTVLTAIAGATVAGCLVVASFSGPLVRAALDATALAILAAYLTAPAWLTASRAQPAPEGRTIHARTVSSTSR